MIFDPIYLLFVAPGLILAFIAQMMVKKAYSEAGKIRSSQGLTGADVAERILRASAIDDVKIEPTEGFLTDHYHPLQKTLRLSTKNFEGNDLAAIGVAAHEVGHAIQHKQGYIPLMMRSALVPIASLGSNLSWWLFAIGLFISSSPLGKNLMLGAILLFAAAFVFTIITLPVELDASARAVRVLAENQIVSSEELVPIKRVLRAAALTYVAAAVMSLLQLLYMLSRYRERR